MVKNHTMHVALYTHSTICICTQTNPTWGSRRLAPFAVSNSRLRPFCWNWLWLLLSEGGKKFGLAAEDGKWIEVKERERNLKLDAHACKQRQRGRKKGYPYRKDSKATHKLASSCGMTDWISDNNHIWNLRVTFQNSFSGLETATMKQQVTFKCPWLLKTVGMYKYFQKI